VSCVFVVILKLRHALKGAAEVDRGLQAFGISESGATSSSLCLTAMKRCARGSGEDADIYSIRADASFAALSQPIVNSSTQREIRAVGLRSIDRSSLT